MTLAIDASVAVKWFFEEAGHGSARALLDRNEALIAPSLVVVEVANAAWKRSQRQEIARDDAQAVADLVARPFAKLVPVESLVSQATAMALSLGRPVHDCLYLALARRERVSLLTADRGLAVVAERAGIDVELIA